jgi:hypothetical protein
MTTSREKKAALVPRPADARPRLSGRQRDVLDSLAVLGDWSRPMDVGGRDGSHHAATLSALARRGLAERKKLHAIYCPGGVTDGRPPSTTCRCKGSCRYRITTAGRRALT